MSTHISVLGYAWLAHCLAFLIAPQAIPINERLRAFLLWSASASALFLLVDPGLVFFAVACILIALAPIAPVPRVALFLVAAPILPMTIEAQIPFPFINHLTALTPYKLVSAVLLIPIFLMQRPQGVKGAKLTAPDVCVVLYIIYTTLHVAVNNNVTIGLRYLVDQSLLLALPYFALRRALVFFEDLDEIFRAILICAIYMAVIALVATGKQWDFYKSLDPASIFAIPDFRGGILRIGVTTSTHSLGLFCGFGLVALEVLKRTLQLSGARLSLLRVVLIIGVFVSGSRGAMVGTALAFALYLSLLSDRKFVRWLLAMMLSLGIVVGTFWLLWTDFDTHDAFERADTFSYRQELLRVSVQHILKYPIFGDHLFYSRPEFETLRQGQGIIDITNFYLQILLHYGMIGFILYFGVCLFSLWPNLLFALGISKARLRIAITREARISSGSASETLGAQPKITRSLIAVPQDILRRFCGLLIGIQVGWLFFITTTSDTGSTVHFGVVCVAMLNAFMRITMEDTAGSLAVDDRHEAPVGPASL